jgi:hypothetical protein
MSMTFCSAAPDGSGLCDWFAELRKVFEVRDLGEPVLYVGIEFSLEPGVVRLTQAEAMCAGWRRSSAWQMPEQAGADGNDDAPGAPHK